MTESKNQIQIGENGGTAATDGELSESALEQVAGGTISLSGPSAIITHTGAAGGVSAKQPDTLSSVAPGGSSPINPT